MGGGRGRKVDMPNQDRWCRVGVHVHGRRRTAGMRHNTLCQRTPPLCCVCGWGAGGGLVCVQDKQEPLVANAVILRRPKPVAAAACARFLVCETLRRAIMESHSRL